ncbi:MAG: ABC transporter ATP-binding protein [Pseudomonadota bacterium]|nr:ABC transporter ATP-binding protein [Pseudomonadota bacterium]
MITVEGLTHYYGERRAIEDIRFQISEHEIVGFLGLNGAGKSTTLRVLAGLLVPSAGSVTIDGVDLVSAGATSRASIGYLPEDPPLYREMTVREFVAYCGELKGLDARTVESRLDGVLKIAQLTHVQHRVIQELSHGYRKRCGIAQAIIHKPKLVILDEPISGLDPRQIVEMRQVIRDLAKDCTVLISSHILGEISETCDRILVLAGGKIVAQGTEAELAARAGGDGARLTLIVRGTEAGIDAALTSAPGVLRYDRHEEGAGLWRLHVSLTTDDREALVTALVKAGVGIRKMVEDESELEQIFLGLTQGASA